MDTHITTTAEYRAQRALEASVTDPRVLDAYDLQEKIREEKRQLEEHQEQLSEMLRDIGTYKNEFYAITNLKRAPRKINMELLRKNFPDLVSKAAPTDKYLLQALIEEYGREALLQIARNHNPEAYDNALVLSISDFDKETGDSSKAYKYAGLAYDERWIEDKSQPYYITYLGTPLNTLVRAAARINKSCEEVE